MTETNHPIVFKQGDPGDAFYIVLDHGNPGDVHVLVNPEGAFAEDEKHHGSCIKFMRKNA